MNNKTKPKRVAPKRVRAEIKRRLILEDIAKGEGYSEIVEKYSKDWGCSPKTTEYYIQDAMAYLRSDEAIENLKSINIQRLDNLYKECATSGDTKNALKAIDLQNKTIGAYEEKLEVKTDEPMEFVFNF